MVLLYQGRVAHLLRNMLVLRTSNFQGATIRPIVPRNKRSIVSGSHHQEPATTPYSCHGVFTDRCIFSLNLSRIQIPTGTSVTNCNHKHGIMLTCRRVHVRPHYLILTEGCLCRLELTYFAGIISKNRLVCKNAVALAYYGSCRLLVMGS